MRVTDYSGVAASTNAPNVSPDETEDDEVIALPPPATDQHIKEDEDENETDDLEEIDRIDETEPQAEHGDDDFLDMNTVKEPELYENDEQDYVNAF